MIGLTVKQPWAWAIAYCGKDIENRTWPVPAKYLTDGPADVMIHAGKGWDSETFGSNPAEFARWAGDRVEIRPDVRHLWPGPATVETEWHPVTEKALLPLPYSETQIGHVIATARLVGSSPVIDSPHEANVWAQYGRGVHHWQLDEVKVLDQPVPAKGRLGLWRPDQELIDNVKGNLA